MLSDEKSRQPWTLRTKYLNKPQDGALVVPLGLFYTHTQDSRGKSSLSGLSISVRNCTVPSSSDPPTLTPVPPTDCLSKKDWSPDTRHRGAPSHSHRQQDTMLLSIWPLTPSTAGYNTCCYTKEMTSCIWDRDGEFVHGSGMMAWREHVLSYSTKSWNGKSSRLIYTINMVPENSGL